MPSSYNVEGSGSGNVEESYKSYLKTYQNIAKEYSQMTDSVFGDIDPNEIARMIKAEKDEKAKAAFMQALPGMIGTGLSAAASIFGALTMNRGTSSTSPVSTTKPVTPTQNDFDGVSDANLQAQLTQVQTDITNKKQEVTAAKSNRTTANNEKKAAKEEAERATNAENKHRDRAAECKSAYAGFVTEIEKLNGEKTTAETSLTGAKSQLKTAEAAPVDPNDSASQMQHQQEIARLNKLISELNAQIDQLKKDIEAKEKLRDEANAEAGKENGLADEEKAKKEEANRTFGVKEQEVKDLSTKITSTESDIKKLESQEKQIKDEIDAREKAQKKQDRQDAGAAKRYEKEYNKDK